MVNISTTFTALLLLAAGALANVPKVEADITTLSTDVIALEELINAYPNSGGTLAAALAIHTSALTVVHRLAVSAVDVAATPALTLADGTTILNSVQIAESTIIKALDEIVTKKAAFEALPIGGVPKIILQDLEYLDGNATVFGENLIKITPASLVPQAKLVRNNIGAALEAALEAYA